MKTVEMIIIIAVFILIIIGIIIRLIQINKRIETKFELQRKYNKYFIETLLNRDYP